MAINRILIFSIIGMFLYCEKEELHKCYVKIDQKELFEINDKDIHSLSGFGKNSWFPNRIEIHGILKKGQIVKIDDYILQIDDCSIDDEDTESQYRLDNGIILDPNHELEVSKSQFLENFPDKLKGRINSVIISRDGVLMKYYVNQAKWEILSEDVELKRIIAEKKSMRKK